MSQRSAKIVCNREPLVEQREDEHFEIGADIHKIVRYTPERQVENYPAD